MATCINCNGTKHIRDDKGKLIRCECLLKELERERFSFVKREDLEAVPLKESKLEELTNKSIRLTTNTKILKKHLIYLLRKNPSLEILGRGVMIFLTDNLEDSEFMRKVHAADLLIITLDGAIENRFIPRLLAGIIESRMANDKGTWLVKNLWNIDHVARTFNPENTHNHDDFKFLLQKLPEVKLA